MGGISFLEKFAAPWTLSSNNSGLSPRGLTLFNPACFIQGTEAQWAAVIINKHSRAKLQPVSLPPAHEAQYCAYSVHRDPFIWTKVTPHMYGCFLLTVEADLWVTHPFLDFVMMANNASDLLTFHTSKKTRIRENRITVKTPAHGWGGPESHKEVQDRVWKSKSNRWLHWQCNPISWTPGRK